MDTTKSDSLPDRLNLELSKPERTLPLLARRLGAAWCDGILLGSVSAGIVTLQLYLAFRNTLTADPSVLWLGAALGFALVFLDVLTFSGPLLFVIAAMLLANFGPEDTKWTLIFYFSLLLPLNLLYHVIYERSTSRATPGKRLFRLKLSDAAGTVPSLKALTMRHFLKGLSFLALLFPIAHYATGNRNQLLHDRVAKIYIVDKATELAKPVALPRVDGPPNSACANLWRRVPAAILDLVAFDALFSVIISLSLLFGSYIMPAAENQTVAFVTFGVLAFGSSLLPLVVSMLTMACFEASEMQATPGKIAMGIVVTNPTGQRITLLEAIQKQLVQCFLYLSFLPLFGIVYGAGAAWCSTTASYELGAYLLVAACLSFYFAYGLTVCATFFKGKQSLLDLMCHRYVLVESKAKTGNSIEVIR